MHGKNVLLALGCAYLQQIHFESIYALCKPLCYYPIGKSKWVMNVNSSSGRQPNHRINFSAQKNEFITTVISAEKCSQFGRQNQIDRTEADRNPGYRQLKMWIRLFVAIFALLLCAAVARADKPAVIKDSEAIKYVGKEVEVRGRVVSVTTSPLGTAFINFGGEYPNQRFAGFIAAGSSMAADQRLTMIQGKTIGITGTIQLRDGKPEIEIVSADQITGLDSQTER